MNLTVERKMIDKLPTEIIFAVLNKIDNLKSINIVNKRIHLITQHIIYRNPIFKKRQYIDHILYLPILFFKTSSVLDRFLTKFPARTQEVFVDSLKPMITPEIVRSHEQINFHFSVFCITYMEYCHFTQYNLANVYLKTTDKCYINQTNFMKYQQFKFSYLATSHIETSKNSTVFDILTRLDIRYIYINTLPEPISYQDIECLPAINCINSSVFKRKECIPLLRIRPFCRKIYFQKNEMVNPDEYRKMKGNLKFITKPSPRNIVFTNRSFFLTIKAGWI